MIEATPSRGPRTFVGRLALLLIAILIIACVLAPFVAWGLAAVFGPDRFSFPRVYDRVLEVLAVIGFIRARRWLGLDSWASLGLGAPERRRDVLLGVGLALGGMILLLGLMYGADALRFFWRYPLGKGVGKALAGASGAVLIGTGEELLFRGILLGGLLRDRYRLWAAVGWTTMVYAVVHFLRGGRQVGEVTLMSGFERVASAFAPLANPEIVPALVGFVILGLLLAYGRLGSRGLHLSIGLHIGFVFTLRVGRLFMDFPRPRNVGLLWGFRHPPLVSGAAGWLALLVTFVVLYLILSNRRDRGAQQGGVALDGPGPEVV